MIPRVYIYAALVTGAVATLSTLYYIGYSNGQQRVLTRLQDDRITVLQDGRKIDERVLAADDDALYCLLVNCERDTAVRPSRSDDTNR